MQAGDLPVMDGWRWKDIRSFFPSAQRGVSCGHLNYFLEFAHLFFKCFGNPEQTTERIQYNAMQYASNENGRLLRIVAVTKRLRLGFMSTKEWLCMDDAAKKANIIFLPSFLCAVF
jgi:hypothetical protein